MVEQQDNNEITLRCKLLDPKDPTMLSCERIPRPILQDNGSELAASKTPQSDQSRSGTTTPSPDVAEDAGSQGYTTITLRKVQLDEKVVYEPVEDPNHSKKDILPGKETQPNLTAMQHRLARSSGCDGKHCAIPREVVAQRNKTASRKMMGKGDGA
jgi:hypothetical protein